MSLKPIEPGCKAVTVNTKIPENSYKSVTVIGLIPHPGGLFKKTVYWEIDTPMKTQRRNMSTGEVISSGLVNFIPEKCLMRIDGHKADELDEQNVREVVK